MRAFAIFVSFFFYVCFATAWPWPANLFIRDTTGHLVVRDDPKILTSAAPASSAAQNTASNTGSSSPTSNPSGTQSGSNPSSKPTGKNDNQQNKGNHTSSVSINPEDPAGGLSMIMPAPTATTYYRYSENITWIWNYTSLVITPSAINVLVSCQDTASTFTIAQNVSVNATQSIVWDTSKETGAGITDKYTLVVFDADNPAGVSATPGPGILGVFNQFVFAMYTSQPYQGVGDGYKCVTCNGAISSAETQAIGMLVTMATITALSFGYFANGFLAL